MSDPLKPSASLLCKLGSVVVHADEYHGDRGHPFDLVALMSALDDPEVREWLAGMRSLALIPEKRN